MCEREREGKREKGRQAEEERRRGKEGKGER
jgi:hypothetical protein